MGEIKPIIKRRGKPGELQKDVQDSIAYIIEKYKKTWLGKTRDRMGGIINSACDEAQQLLYKDIIEPESEKHSTDKFIEEIKSFASGNGSLEFIFHQLCGRLRYHAIKWADENLIDSMGVDGSLKHRGHENWIPKDNHG